MPLCGTLGVARTSTWHLTIAFFRLRDAGNTVIVIEHNLDVMHHADWLIDLGPGGGKDGGEIVYAGPRAGSGASRYAQGSGLSTNCMNESRMGPERPGGRFG
ncbi:MAG TPA: hypothetical protein PK392_13945 [Opitutaceae bacterium]|nr:hypothetical protein [Opitutaceae bacterium]